MQSGSEPLVCRATSVPQRLYRPRRRLFIPVQPYPTNNLTLTLILILNGTLTLSYFTSKHRCYAQRDVSNLRLLNDVRRLLTVSALYALYTAALHAAISIYLSAAESVFRIVSV